MSSKQCGGAEKVACLQNAKDHTMAKEEAAESSYYIVYYVASRRAHFLPNATLTESFAENGQSPNGQKVFRYVDLRRGRATVLPTLPTYPISNMRILVD